MFDNIKVIAFDLFGTVFNADGVSHEEKDAYVNHVRQYRTTQFWRPLHLPTSWQAMPPHADSAPGIRKLRILGYKCVTLTNWPYYQIQAASQNARIEWDQMILLERYRVYKPSLVAYAAAAERTRVLPSEVLMVTANPGAGDDTYPARIGMRSLVIRGDSEISTIINLALRMPAID